MTSSLTYYQHLNVDEEADLFFVPRSLGNEVLGRHPITTPTGFPMVPMGNSGAQNVAVQRDIVPSKSLAYSEIDIVRMDENCEEGALFIFEIRTELVRAGLKGKGMWAEIRQKYEERYGHRLEIAALQMRLQRAFAKHAVWPENEVCANLSSQLYGR